MRVIAIITGTLALSLTLTANQWPGPTDFRQTDSGIYGDWHNGGALGVAYYTGKHAQRMPNFIKTGEKLALEIKMPYREIHAGDIRPSDKDANGCLLYPDGSARVRLLIMPGGVSTLTTMEIAGVETREEIKEKTDFFTRAAVNPRQAFSTGMNYLGVCGGFFTASSGYSIPSVNTAWSLWPGKQKNIGPAKKQPLPDMVFEEKHQQHPLYQASNKGIVQNMWFNGGPLGVQDGVPDTEYLAKYAGGAMPEIIGDWSLVAYRPKNNPRSGRLVLCTGHPEVNNPDFLDAMADYAINHSYGVAATPIRPGETSSAVIGDHQLHYYRFDSDGGELKIKLEGEGAGHCRVLLRRGLPPTFNDTHSGRLEFPTEPDTYFIGVYGEHDVLNGLPYRLSLVSDK